MTSKDFINVIYYEERIGYCYLIKMADKYSTYWLYDYRLLKIENNKVFLDDIIFDGFRMPKTIKDKKNVADYIMYIGQTDSIDEVVELCKDHHSNFIFK